MFTSPCCYCVRVPLERDGRNNVLISDFAECRDYLIELTAAETAVNKEIDAAWLLIIAVFVVVQSKHTKNKRCCLHFVLGGFADGVF